MEHKKRGWKYDKYVSDNDTPDGFEFEGHQIIKLKGYLVHAF